MAMIEKFAAQGNSIATQLGLFFGFDETSRTSYIINGISCTKEEFLAHEFDEQEMFFFAEDDSCIALNFIGGHDQVLWEEQIDILTRSFKIALTQEEMDSMFAYDVHIDDEDASKGTKGVLRFYFDDKYYPDYIEMKKELAAQDE